MFYFNSQPSPCASSLVSANRLVPALKREKHCVHLHSILQEADLNTLGNYNNMHSFFIHVVIN